VLQLDSAHVDALTDLGMLHYDLAMAQKPDENKAKNSYLREARGYLARAEHISTVDDAVYERLCQISLALEDDRSFLTYAKKSAERFPFDRQYYNLGLAYFGVGDFQNVVKSQKEAIQKFPQSPYLGGYYRQLGRGYMKIDRDQTAQRNLETGLSAVDARLKAEVKEHGSASDAARRLADDRSAILQLLRRLYQTYHFDDKLKDVERLLNEADSRR
jgi:tetratricopeptide (TPR) repeat protein